MTAEEFSFKLLTLTSNEDFILLLTQAIEEGALQDPIVSPTSLLFEAESQTQEGRTLNIRVSIATTRISFDGRSLAFSTKDLCGFFRAFEEAHEEFHIQLGFLTKDIINSFFTDTEKILLDMEKSFPFRHN